MQNEVHLYGASRLGIKNQQTASDSTVLLSGGFVSGGKRLFTRGGNVFELGNHLGSVLEESGKFSDSCHMNLYQLSNN